MTGTTRAGGLKRWVFWGTFMGLVAWVGAVVLRAEIGHDMVHAYEICSRSAQITDSRQMREMAQCMYPRGTNPLLRWFGQIDRYRYLAHPDLPCRYVGEWSGGREHDLYVSTLKADGTVSIRPVDVQNPDAVKEATMTGYWSASGPDRLVWFYPQMFVWPLDENPVEWLDDDHLLIHENNGEVTRYRRLTPRQDECH